MKINKTLIIRSIFIAWVVLWINFMCRDLFKKGYFNDYKILIKKDKEGKRSYVYGDNFYEFLKYSKDSIPKISTFNIIGVEELSLEHRRAVYFLYPLLESDSPDYILVYNNPEYKKDKYALFKMLDNNRYILKKK